MADVDTPTSATPAPVVDVPAGYTADGRLTDEVWDALDQATGQRRPRGRVVSLEQFRRGIPIKKS